MRRFFVFGPISLIFCLGTPNYKYFKIGGKKNLISKEKSELETLEVYFLLKFTIFPTKFEIEKFFT